MLTYDANGMNYGAKCKLPHNFIVQVVYPYIFFIPNLLFLRQNNFKFKGIFCRFNMKISIVFFDGSSYIF